MLEGYVEKVEFYERMLCHPEADKVWMVENDYWTMYLQDAYTVAATWALSS